MAGKDKTLLPSKWAGTIPNISTAAFNCCSGSDISIKKTVEHTRMMIHVIQGNSFLGTVSIKGIMVEFPFLLDTRRPDMT
jgi:hypothetical protein